MTPRNRRGRDRRTALPAPWRRVDTNDGKLSARYEHPAGYVIEHCGHPTALWPYALWATSPAGGQMLITAPNGRAFARLADAAKAVAQRLEERGLDAPAPRATRPAPGVLLVAAEA